MIKSRILREGRGEHPVAMHCRTSRTGVEEDWVGMDSARPLKRLTSVRMGNFIFYG